MEIWVYYLSLYHGTALNRRFLTIISCISGILMSLLELRSHRNVHKWKADFVLQNKMSKQKIETVAGERSRGPHRWDHPTDQRSVSLFPSLANPIIPHPALPLWATALLVSLALLWLYKKNPIVATGSTGKHIQTDMWRTIGCDRSKIQL